MRQLIMIRHAEAGFAGVGQNDFDRPLTDHGMQSALSQARVLEELKMIPDQVICSPALRTRTTWDIMQRQLKNSLSIDFKLEHPQALYNAPPKLIIDMIKATHDHVDIVMLVGHNPGVHEAVMELSDPIHGQPPSEIAKRVHAGFPPASMAIFDFTARHWFESTKTTLILQHFLPPRL